MTANLQYLEGDATHPIGDGTRIIAHVCNNQGGWGAGFVVALGRRYPEAEAAYRRWSDWAQLPLGETQFVYVGGDVYVANMVAQDGYKTAGNPTPLKINALERCLGLVREWALDRITPATVHMPRIGTGLGGAKWSDVEPVIQRALSGCELVVYEWSGKR